MTKYVLSGEKARVRPRWARRGRTEVCIHDKVGIELSSTSLARRPGADAKPNIVASHDLLDPVPQPRHGIFDTMCLKPCQPLVRPLPNESVGHAAGALCHGYVLERQEVQELDRAQGTVIASTAVECRCAPPLGSGRRRRRRRKGTKACDLKVTKGIGEVFVRYRVVNVGWRN